MALSKRLRFEVFKRDNFTCQYCGAKPPDTVLEVDHVHPRSLGGRDLIENLKTACWNCNRGKGAVIIPKIYKLDTGPDFSEGPRHGDLVTRTEQFPVYWVFSRGDGWDFFEDELDADVYFTRFEDRLKWGHPARRAGDAPQTAWHEFPDGVWAPRQFAGFYLAITGGRDDCLCWFPGGKAFDYGLEISTYSAPMEDYE